MEMVSGLRTVLVNTQWSYKTANGLAPVPLRLDSRCFDVVVPELPPDWHHKVDLTNEGIVVRHGPKIFVDDPLFHERLVHGDPAAVAEWQMVWETRQRDLTPLADVARWQDRSRRGLTFETLRFEEDRAAARSHRAKALSIIKSAEALAEGNAPAERWRELAQHIVHFFPDRSPLRLEDLLLVMPATCRALAQLLDTLAALENDGASQDPASGTLQDQIHRIHEAFARDVASDPELPLEWFVGGTGNGVA